MFQFDPNRPNLPQRFLEYIHVLYQKRWYGMSNTLTLQKYIGHPETYYPEGKFTPIMALGGRKTLPTCFPSEQQNSGTDAARCEETSSHRKYRAARASKTREQQKSTHVETPCPVTANFSFNPRYIIKMLRHTHGRYGREEGTWSSPTPPPPPA